MPTQGEAVLDAARGWIGTPYRHQGSVKGVGCDCLGLVRGIWRELYGAEPEVVPAYAADWGERSGEERLLEAARRHFLPVVDPEGAGADRMLQHHAGLSAAQPGDLLLFRFHPKRAAKHAGIYVDPLHFIHAYEQAAVILSPLVPAWRRRVAGVFRFPEN